MTAAAFADQWEGEFAALLEELTLVQGELLRVLEAKRRGMAARDMASLKAMENEEAALAERLKACHDRRQALLASANESGIACDSLGKLAKQIPSGKRDGLGKQLKEATVKMRQLQQESLANWVIAQRTVLHLSQLIEIIATGGRLQPTYGKSDAALARGALVNQEA